MWKKVFLTAFFCCLSLTSLQFAQDVQQGQLTQALRILEGSEENLTFLEQSIQTSNKTIAVLSNKISDMQTIIREQQTLLRQESENLQASDTQWKIKLETSEQTIESLSASYNSLLTQEAEQKTEIAKLTQSNLRKTIVIICEGAVILGFIALLALKFIVKSR